MLERTLRRLPRTPDVLDLCCGHGFYFDINPSAAGLDGDRACVESLQARGLSVTLGNVLERLPYADDGFGFVVAHDVLEHFTLDELRTIVAEVHRILRPGGSFVVVVPNRKGFDFGVELGVGHRLFVTAEEIRLLARDAFEVTAHYPEPLPRWIGRFFTHNKEVFVLRKT